MRKVRKMTKMRKMRKMCKMRKMRKMTKMRRMRKMTKMRRMRKMTKMRRMRDYTDLRKSPVLRKMRGYTGYTESASGLARLFPILLLLILISYFTSHAVVTPFGTDWFEPMLVWIVIVMPTWAGKSTLFKFLRGILRTVRKRIEEMEKKKRKWKSRRLGRKRSIDGKDGCDDL